MIAPTAKSRSKLLAVHTGYGTTEALRGIDSTIFNTEDCAGVLSALYNQFLLYNISNVNVTAGLRHLFPFIRYSNMRRGQFSLVLLEARRPCTAHNVSSRCTLYAANIERFNPF